MKNPPACRRRRTDPGVENMIGEEREEEREEREDQPALRLPDRHMPDARQQDRQCQDDDRD